MRSVSAAANPPRNSRAKPARRDTRKTARARRRAKPVRIVRARAAAFGRRTEFRDDIFARAGRWLRRKLTFRRPVLYMTGALVAFVAVGGAVRRRLCPRRGRQGRWRGHGASRPMPASAFPSFICPARTARRRKPSWPVLGFKPGQSIFAADLPHGARPSHALPWVAAAAGDAPLSGFHLRQHRREAALRAVAVRPRACSVVERVGRASSPGDARRIPAICRSLSASAPKGGDDLVEAIAGPSRRRRARARPCSASASGAGT